MHRNHISLVDEIFRRVTQELSGYTFDDHDEVHSARMYLQNRMAEIDEELLEIEMELAQKED